MKGERSRYRSGHFNGGKMILLQRVSLWRENGHIMVAVSLVEGE